MRDSGGQHAQVAIMESLFVNFGNTHNLKMTNPRYPFLNEEQKFKLRLQRTHTQRFDLLMKLIRINLMLKSAKILPAKA